MTLVRRHRHRVLHRFASLFAAINADDGRGRDARVRRGETEEGAATCTRIRVSRAWLAPSLTPRRKNSKCSIALPIW